jgi:hypothetical protein
MLRLMKALKNGAWTDGSAHIWHRAYGSRLALRLAGTTAEGVVDASEHTASWSGLSRPSRSSLFETQQDLGTRDKREHDG